jgi:hypothetical protein
VFVRRLRYKKGAVIDATFLTFAVSAIWHGFYPGYYIFFFASAFADLAYKKA